MRRKTPKYRSRFEATVAAQLKRDKIRAQYEPRTFPYTLHRSYRPDWILPSGVIVEAKGYFDRDAKAKMIAVKRDNPHLDIRFVFQRAYPAYIKWAERNGFRWAEDKVPREW